MKYYSEVTKKVYDTVNDLKAAETAITEKTAKRKADADYVESTFKEYVESKKKYENALKDFCDKWGAYHKTIKSNDVDESSMSLRDLLTEFLF